MPTRYDSLKTGALRLAVAPGTAWKEPFYVLRFPKQWKESLLTLAQDRSIRTVEQTSIPIGTLNRALRALVPDIICVATFAARNVEAPWVFSDEPISAEALAPIVHAWARNAFPGANPARVHTVIAQELRPEALRWERELVDLADWSQDPNGTAKAARRELYSLLPDVLAARLSQPGVACDHGSSISRFRRAPAPGGRGAELVSWPPRTYQDSRGETWYYSFTLLLTVQTVPFEARPAVHCDVGLRRWATKRLRLPGDRETSVYLLSSVPWIRGLTHSHSFQVAPIKWGRFPTGRQTADGPVGTITWGSDLAPIIDELGAVLQAPLPTPADLCLNPLIGLGELADGPVAAVVYRTGLNYDHRVGAGVMPRDRRDLLAWVADALEGSVAAGERIDRVPYRLARPRSERLSTTSTGAESTARSAAALRSLGSATEEMLSLDILWQTGELRDKVSAVVLRSLGLPSEPTSVITDSVHRWEAPGLALTIRTLPLGALGGELALDQCIRRRRDRLQKAVRHRADQIASVLPPMEGCAAAFIELQGAAHFTHDADADPKHALRLGLAAANRVTQFITPRVEDEKPETARFRVEKAWRDLQRQLGFQWAPLRFPLKKVTVPEPLQYVGIWLIKQNRDSSPTRMQQQVPVAVRLASNTADVLAIFPGLDDWLPYREALQRIAQMHPFGGAPRTPEQVLHFVEQICRDVQIWGDTLLLTHAQNLRGAWKWLGNGLLVPDQIGFGPAPVSVKRLTGLRHVRVRTNDQHETPECFAEAGKQVGFSKGLWRLGGSGRVFASTAGKPATAKKLSASLSKVEPWHSAKRAYDPKPDEHAFNPQLVELTVAAIQPGDESWAWAALAHELRSAASHHDEALLLPLPLHLARQMGEYVLTLPESDASGGK